MADPDLDFMLADLAGLGPAESFTLVSGEESCGCLFDDQEAVVEDHGHGESLLLQTVVRYRQGAITKPAVGGDVTVQKPDGDEAFTVREAAKDPGNPGMIRVVVARAA